jgi:F0F1-type ATP synthase membrane subunit b/b'
MIQLAQAGLQNDKINFSQIMDILTDSSISSVRRKIENAERQKMDQLKQDSEQQQQMMQQQQQMAQQVEAMRTEGKQQSEQFKADLALELERVRTEGKIDLEKAKSELQKDLKMTESSDAVMKTMSDVEKLGMQLKHEAKENELDRQSDEEIEKLKLEKSIKTNTSR